MSDMTLQQARTAVEAAIRKAEQLGAKMNIAVVDAGASQAFARMDGMARLDRYFDSQTRTARFFDMNTGDGNFPSPADHCSPSSTQWRADHFSRQVPSAMHPAS